MKVLFRTNLGSRDAIAVGLDASQCVAGAEVCVVGRGVTVGRPLGLLLTRKSDLRGRTPRQVQYLQQIQTHDITFATGPAGTGKTYLAVASAVDALERDHVKSILLVRPAVEAGERLGFLPGDMTQKVDPYLRPLYDARGRIRVSFPKITAQKARDVDGVAVHVVVDEGASYELGDVTIDTVARRDIDRTRQAVIRTGQSVAG